VVLDVAATNPAAQRLYERLGFAVVVERRSTLGKAQGRVADQRRMQRQTPARFSRRGAS
jgi:ribosomal protein S18 acetylase RimI-like enzyme